MAETRRDFVRKSAGLGALGLAGNQLFAATRSVSVRIESDVTGAPVKWAAGNLEEALKAKGVPIQTGTSAFVVSVVKAKPSLGTVAFRLTQRRSGVTVTASVDSGFVYGFLV